MKCPDCETDNDFVYVGITRAECPNKQCRNYDEKVYAAWVQTTKTHPNDKEEDVTDEEQAQADAMAEYIKQLQCYDDGDAFD